MIKNIAWNMFKNTGNIDTFLEFRQIKDIENGNIANATTLNDNSDIFNTNVVLGNGNVPTTQKVELNGDNKNKWNNNF